MQGTMCAGLRKEQGGDMKTGSGPHVCKQKGASEWGGAPEPKPNILNRSTEPPTTSKLRHSKSTGEPGVSRTSSHREKGWTRSFAFSMF